MSITSKYLTVDPQKCAACRTCEVVCSLEKTGKCNPAEACIHVESFEEEQFFSPTICMQCEEAWCARACPAAAISKDEETGALIVDRDKCVGCRMCTMVCPFGQIAVSPYTGKSSKCDLCGGDPMCVKFCPTEAIKFEKIDSNRYEKRKAVTRKIMIASRAEVDTE